MLCIETINLSVSCRNLREPQDNSREPWAPGTPLFRALVLQEIMQFNLRMRGGFLDFSLHLANIGLGLAIPLRGVIEEYNYISKGSKAFKFILNMIQSFDNSSS